ncbi:hypothetical protein [Agrococcus sp. Marseille-P2731]|uniref:hypothetical protein n=1 Tax=Agrococcus sp. Marseille-P2731 TaxID=1841862 RepID=UPI000930370A|nr:hypothetical protein [Agrococcus sp. Marseille-P2731]
MTAPGLMRVPWRQGEAARTVEVILVSTMPAWLPPALLWQLRAPIVVAAVTGGGGVALLVAVALDTATRAWGAGAVAAAVGAAVAVLPSLCQLLGGPSGLAAALLRERALLHALGLERGIERRASLLTAAPGALLAALVGLLASLVLGVRGASSASLTVLSATLVGALAAVALARALARTAWARRPLVRAATKLAAVCALCGAGVAVQESLAAPAVPAQAVHLAVFAIAVWCSGDVLLLDGRPGLRLGRALCSVGARPWVLSASAVGGLLLIAVPVGAAVGAVLGGVLDEELAWPSGAIVSCALLAAGIAVILEPVPTDALARLLVYGACATPALVVATQQVPDALQLLVLAVLVGAVHVVLVRRLR